LIQSRAPERITTFDFHTQWQVARPGEPGASRTNVWLTGLTPELIADVETDRTTNGSGRANVDSPQHTRLYQSAGVVARHPLENIRRIAQTLDHMTPALSGQMAVAIHEPRNHCCSPGIEDLGASQIGVVIRPDPVDLPTRNRHAHSGLQTVRATVRESGVVHYESSPNTYTWSEYRRRRKGHVMSVTASRSRPMKLVSCGGRL
jgi:hypothetical protein